MMKLCLFDIDGTLIKPRGVGQRAAERAFFNLYGIDDIMAGINTCGMTDPLILSEMFQKGFNRNYYQNEEEEFYFEYIKCLKEELKEVKKLNTLPGVIELLDFLHSRRDILLAVGTGNIEAGAWLKLEYAGLRKYFRFGGFGSDSESREKLLRIAVIKGRMKYNNNNNFDRVYVIGDTPNDIIHGRSVGAETIAVATGLFSKDELKDHNPHYLLDQLDNSFISEII